MFKNFYSFDICMSPKGRPTIILSEFCTNYETFFKQEHTPTRAVPRQRDRLA